MDKDILKKSLIIGIVFLLSSSYIPFVTASDGKPDLKITDIKGTLSEENHMPGFDVIFTNEGDAPIPDNVVFKINVKLKTLDLRSTKYETNLSLSGLQIYPNENDSGFIDISGAHFGIYRCYFEIDLNNLIEESNESNNNVWVYFLVFGISGFKPIRTGKANLNSRPKISNPSPSNNKENVSLDLNGLSFGIYDADYEWMDFRITSNPRIASTDWYYGAHNGYYGTSIVKLQYSTTYNWTVIVTDGIFTTMKNFSFTTAIENDNPNETNSPDNTNNTAFNIEWNKSYNLYGASFVQQTTDGGYIYTGQYYSRSHHEDLCLVKTDSQGNLEWKKAYTPYINNYDAGRCVRETEDGGFIAAGWTMLSNDDVYVVRTDEKGNLLWQKSYGESSSEQAVHMILEDNGDCTILAEKHEPCNYSLLRIDEDGNVIWNRIYGGNSWDYPDWFDKTDDGGYIITGRTNSYTESGWEPVWLIKTNDKGIEQWNTTFESVGSHSCGIFVKQMDDGGYLISATKYEYDLTDPDEWDIVGWIIKTDDKGVKIWDKIIDEESDCYIRYIYNFEDGRLMLFGKLCGKIWIIETDHLGNEMWNGTMDMGYGLSSCQRTSDGGFIISGSNYWYYGRLLKIGTNKIPRTPELIGPDSGQKGEELTYHVFVSDPDSDNVSYLFRWDDKDESEWSDFVPSNIWISKSYTFNEAGNHTVSVKIKDEHGDESLRASLDVIIQKSKNKEGMIFNLFKDIFHFLKK